MPEKLLLSSKEVGEIIGVSSRQVWNLLNRGMIPSPVRVGRRTLWKRKDLEEWIDQDCPVQPMPSPTR